MIILDVLFRFFLFNNVRHYSKDRDDEATIGTIYFLAKMIVTSDNFAPIDHINKIIDNIVTTKEETMTSNNI